jgi:glycine cleavage system aminomethyltransferase T
MKRSALYYLHRRSSAHFAERHGWEMPVSFASSELDASQVREHVGLADLSYRTKFDTQTQPRQLFWPLGRDHYLVVGEPPLDPPPGATDVTSVYANLFLAGPQSRAVLGKLTSLNVSDARLANLSCAQASLAHVHSIVLREDIGSLPAFHVLFSREYGESVWESIVHAGHEFHLQPFGLGALALLQS